MNTSKSFLLLSGTLLGGMMLAGLTGCSGDDDATAVPVDGVRVRRMTITETDAAAARQVLTRASLTEGDGLTASWTANDGLTYCNLSRKYALTEDIYSGPLTATTTAATSQFTGDVECAKGDYLAVVYPATTFSENTRYTLSLAGQDGTLETLATKYHYVFGKAEVTAVTDQTATATMGRMKSLLTVCKFAFVDKDGGAAIPVRSLTISYGGGVAQSDIGTYPQSATVSIGANVAQADVHAKEVTGSQALSVACSTVQEAVYVALMPTSAQCTYQFTVTNASGTYSGTARATLTEGEYVVATGLRLTKQH